MTPELVSNSEKPAPILVDDFLRIFRDHTIGDTTVSKFVSVLKTRYERDRQEGRSTQSDEERAAFESTNYAMRGQVAPCLACIEISGDKIDLLTRLKMLKIALENAVPRLREQAEAAEGNDELAESYTFDAEEYASAAESMAEYLGSL